MPNMKSIPLKTKETRSYKVDVAFSAHVADVVDWLCQIEITLIQHIPVLPKDKFAMHMTTHVKKPNQFIKCFETRIPVTDWPGRKRGCLGYRGFFLPTFINLSFRFSPIVKYENLDYNKSEIFEHPSFR